jgi:probable rRNA maturation factor
MRLPKREVHVECAPGVDALSVAVVRQTLASVCDGEGVGAADLSVTFLSGQRMRALNRRTLDRDRATDVIAFSLPHRGRVVGDIYVCPSVARRSAKSLSISAEEELLRLVVHGMLHVLGYEHPENEDRAVSTMWRLQEHYLNQLREVMNL